MLSTGGLRIERIGLLLGPLPSIGLLEQGSQLIGDVLQEVPRREDPHRPALFVDNRQMTKPTVADEASAGGRVGGLADRRNVGAADLADRRCLWVSALGHDPFQHVTLGEDARQFTVLDDQQGTDPVLDHASDASGNGLVGRRTDYLF